MDERAKAAFDAAIGAVNQLLTLGTGTIGGGIALFHDSKLPGFQFTSALVPWGLGLVALSVALGLFAVGALTGQLGAPGIAAPTIYAGPVRFFHTAQMLAFGVGLGLLVAAVL